MGRGVYLWEKMMKHSHTNFRQQVGTQTVPNLLSGTDYDVENGPALLTLPMHSPRLRCMFSPKAVYNFENCSHFFHVLLKAVK